MTLGINGLYVILSINDIFIILLLIMLSVVILSVVILSVVMLSVIMLSVEAPPKDVAENVEMDLREKEQEH
jgi:hypothetical protein